MLNKVMLIGRLTGEPEVRPLPSGKVASFSVAVNKKYKDKNGEWKEEAYFFDVESYGQLAERVGTFGKGYQILIEGELRQDRWETPTGEKKSKVKVVADRVVLIAKPEDKKVDDEVAVETENFDDIPW